MAAANTKSKNNSVQPGRRTWRSWAGQTLGALKTRTTIVVKVPVAASLREASLEYRKSHADRAAHRAAATALISDRSRNARSSCIGNVLIFLRCVAAHADGADDVSFKHDRNSTLQRRRPRQSQSSDATVANLIFKYFAWPTENRRRSRFANANLNARNLRVVKSLQQ